MSEAVDIINKMNELKPSEEFLGVKSIMKRKMKARIVKPIWQTP